MLTPSRLVKGACALFSAAFLLAACGTPSQSDNPHRESSPAAEARIKTVADPQTFRYGNDDPRQFGDFFLPPHLKKGQKVPLVVFLHGGGWTQNSTAASANPVVRDLAAHGVAVWNVEYRGVNKDPNKNVGGWPMTYEDVAQGIDYIPELAKKAREEHGVELDLDHVVASGYSAGGNLAAWACSRPVLAAGIPGSNPRFAINRCVGMAGVYDMALAYEQHDQFVRALLGGTPTEYPYRYFDTSPAENVNPYAHIEILHGKNDRTVNVDEVKAFVRKAKRNDVDINSTILPDADHLSWTRIEGDQWARARGVILDQAGVKTTGS